MREMNIGAQTTGMRTGFALAIALLALFGGAAESWAQHQAQEQANAAQAAVSHPDVVLTSGAAAVQLLPVNSSRVTAICQMIGTIGTNTARIGDASIGASQGTQLSATSPGATIDVTGPLYGYSSTGATLDCTEVVRP